MGTKVCSRQQCTHGGKPQPVNNFNKLSSAKDGLASNCNDCVRAYNKKYVRAAATKARRREYMLVYFQTPKSAAYRRAYRKRPPVRLANRLRNRLNDALRACQAGRKASAVRDLGCTIPELIAYLEAKFLPGMTWENWSFDGWHIDHIKPLASFDLSDPAQARAAVHYTNLQPLWAADNLAKGDSVAA